MNVWEPEELCIHCSGTEDDHCEDCQSCSEDEHAEDCEYANV